MTRRPPSQPNSVSCPRNWSFLPEQRPTVHTRIGQIVAVARFVVSFSTFPVAVGHGDSLPNSARPDPPSPEASAWQARPAVAHVTEKRTAGPFDGLMAGKPAVAHAERMSGLLTRPTGLGQSHPGSSGGVPGSSGDAIPNSGVPGTQYLIRSSPGLRPGPAVPSR